MSLFKTLLLVGAGSFAGGVGRFFISRAMQPKAHNGIPWGTMVVNVTGCFLIGIVYACSTKGNLSETSRLALASGLLGGFTTFSAFSSETLGLLQANLPGQALGYVLATVLLGLLANYAGWQAVKWLGGL
jgi:CrcB protein